MKLVASLAKCNQIKTGRNVSLLCCLPTFEYFSKKLILCGTLSSFSISLWFFVFLFCHVPKLLVDLGQLLVSVPLWIVMERFHVF